MAAESVALAINHQPIGCLLRDRFPLFRAEILPTVAIRTAKIYFRSESYPDFYYVVMTATAGGEFQGVIPKPSPETDRLVYYIEAVGPSFESARTEEVVTDIGEECRRDPAAAYYTGQNPGITVGATQAGAAALPPGFQAGGIAGFISAAGGGAAAGGGFGVGTAIIVGAGAAAGVGVIGAAGGGSSSTSVQPSGVMVTTTVSGNTSTGASTSVPPGATTTTPTTSSVPPGGSSTTTTVVGGSTTTTTVGGSTTTAPSTTTSSTSSTTTTTTIIPAPVACFTLRSLSGCKVEIDARCSSGAITEYRWTIHRSGGPVSDSRSTPDPFVHDWSNDSACEGAACSFARLVELVAVGPGGNNRFTDNARVMCVVGLVSGAHGLDTSFLSTMAGPSAQGVARGEILLNESRNDLVDGSMPAHHHLRAPAGMNRVEARTLNAVSGEGWWRFDFSASEHFVAGSLQVEAGAVLSIDAYSVTFRLSQSPGETIRFRYRLSAR
jgi:hypothetical protein